MPPLPYRPVGVLAQHKPWHEWGKEGRRLGTVYTCQRSVVGGM